MDVADKTIVRHQVAGVSCRLRVVHALNQRARGWNLPATRVFGQQMKVYGEQMEHEEVVFPSNVPDVSSFGHQRERSWKDMGRGAVLE